MRDISSLRGRAGAVKRDGYFFFKKDVVQA